MDAKVIEIPLDQIVLTKRARKDAGDVTELCDSIEEVGLLQPIVITESNQLVAGLRRMAAFRHLARKTIPAVVATNLIDARDLLIAERDENECRRPFSTLEAVAMGRALEELEKPKADERRRLHGNTAPGKGKNTAGKSPEVSAEESSRVREIVGEAIGMAGKTYQNAKAVVLAAEEDPDTFGPIAEEMDRTGKVRPAFDKVREIKSGKRQTHLSAPIDEIIEGISASKAFQDDIDLPDERLVDVELTATEYTGPHHRPCPKLRLSLVYEIACLDDPAPDCQRQLVAALVQYLTRVRGKLGR